MGELSGTSKGRFLVLSLSPADLMLFFCVLVWSANVSFVKELLSYWSPFSLASVRMVGALFGFTVVILLTERSVRIARKDIWRVVAAGASGIFGNQVAFVFALKYSHASSVALLLAMIPVFVALISAAIGFERLTFWTWLGLPLSLIGVFIIVAAEPGASMSIGSLQGNLFALMTALSWAVYTILVQPLVREYSVARISFWAIVVGLAGLLGPGIASLQPSVTFNEPWWAWLLVLYSSLGAIFMTNFLWYLGTHRLGPARGSLYAFLQPFLGVFFAVIILGDTANWVEVIGGVVIIAGIITARRAPKLRTLGEEIIATGEPPVPG